MKPAETKKITGMSDAAVQAKTGKTWPEWFDVLNKAGARKMNHQAIVALLRQEYDVGSWWQQMVTVGYERARGLREKHQTPSGFSISRSRTLALPLSRVFQAWHDSTARARWLRETITVRKAVKNKSLRITWADGRTSVDVSFYARGNGKSQVSVQHDKLTSARAAALMKTYWAGRLNALAKFLAS